MPGLANLGNTCFANSVIQCLVHTKLFSAYALSSFHSKNCARSTKEPEELLTRHKTRSKDYPEVDVQKFCSFCLIESHIHQLVEAQQQGVKFVYPMSMVKLIKRFDGLFEIGTQSDAHEFLLCILEDMLNSSSGYSDNFPIKHQKETVISQVFKGQMERQIICINCHNETKIQEDFLDLQLNLSKDQEEDSFCNFDTCVNNFFQTDTLLEEDGYNCATCKKKTIA
jgi:ubiquitin carboxyl-terminal hydrolase 36/42